ncbi:MAG: hypothetical protein GY822_11920, partial [Deltaproteobacteria bacterium]|nr:hypothetical protein [Deltaproteobacteria bacterium]
YLHQAKELAQVGSALYGVWQGCEEGFSKLTTPLAPGNSTTFCVAGPTNANDPTGFVKANVAQPSGVGHHYVPQQVIRDYAKKMTAYAMDIAYGNVSGPTYPSHNVGSMGGVKHSRYNEIVAEELELYMEANDIKKMNGDHMLDFSEKMRKGLDHAGDVHDELRDFNNAVDCAHDAYLKGGKGRGFKILRPETKAKLKKWAAQRGRNCRFTQGLKYSLLMSVMGGLLSQYSDALQIAATSSNFKNGVGALAKGKMTKAEFYFFGGHPHRSGSDISYQSGFVGELNSNGCSLSGQHFRDAWFKAKKAAADDAYRHQVRPKDEWEPGYDLF